ncbi:MAG: hypothetical protein U0T83_06195 [Bacteriovoracaceae bacterium]
MNTKLALPNNPHHLWEQFFSIAKIPRVSKKEEKIRDYIINIAKKFDLNFKVDSVGNLVVFVPASKGFEQRETLIIQNHLDMVCDAIPLEKSILRKRGLQFFEMEILFVLMEQPWAQIME